MEGRIGSMERESKGSSGEARLDRMTGGRGRVAWPAARNGEEERRPHSGCKRMPMDGVPVTMGSGVDGDDGEEGGVQLDGVEFGDGGGNRWTEASREEMGGGLEVLQRTGKKTTDCGRRREWQRRRGEETWRWQGGFGAPVSVDGGLPVAGSQEVGWRRARLPEMKERKGVVVGLGFLERRKKGLRDFFHGI